VQWGPEPRFSSGFESGNLQLVVKTGEYKYEMVLQNDTNSDGSTQWFYFAVSGLKRHHSYTFRIVNLVGW
jgi:cytosolic carboxypeptidase protein 2/3